MAIKFEYRGSNMKPFFGLIISLLLIFIAFYINPSFVADKISSGGLLPNKTTIAIIVFQISTGIIGVLTLLLSISFLLNRHLFYTLANIVDIAKLENSKFEKYIPYILLIIGGCAYIIAAYPSYPLGYGGDSFSHYFISCYSWKHPELFLDNWGKPFFTLVSSPFSQFGWTGMTIFNIICALLTAYFTYVYCKKLQIPNRWLVIILVAFSPIYFVSVPTGFTEPLFTLILILAAYLLFEEKYILAAILVSFLPFVRSEGFLVLPLFLFVLLLRKQFFKTFLVATGLLIYSVIGYFVNDNILWIFSETPYKYQGYAFVAYGKGSFFYYFKVAPKLFSLPVVFLITLGFYNLVVMFLKNQNRVLNKKKLIEVISIMTGSFMVYFLSHCLFWWKGIFASAGLIRVMAGTIPGAAFTGLIGLQLITKKLREIKTLNSFLVIIIAVLTVISAIWFIPVWNGTESELVKEAALWVKDNGYSKNMLYYNNRILPFVLDVDPFDKSRIKELQGPKKGMETNNIPMYSIIFWDSHFSPNEGGLPLENLMTNPDLKLLKVFALGRNSVHIFMKTPQDE
jgi:hypothetical protein